MDKQNYFKGENMKPEEAIALVDQICAQVQLNRQTHVKVTMAINVLSTLVNGATNKKKKDKDG